MGSLIAGVKRAVFSNESGIGSAPIAYAAAKSSNYLNTGFMSLLSPVVDTIFVCSMTAFVIIITGVDQNAEGIQGVQGITGPVGQGFRIAKTYSSLAKSIIKNSNLRMIVTKKNYDQIKELFED